MVDEFGLDTLAYDFPENFVLPAKGIHVLSYDPDDFLAYYGKKPSAYYFFLLLLPFFS